MNRILVGLLTLALLGWCYAAPHDIGKPHEHTDEAPGTVHTHEHEHQGVKHTHEHDHQDPDHAHDHDDVDPTATDEERPGPGSASFTREERDLPRPGRPRQENDEENNSGTRNLPRPSQVGGDENEEGNSNTKDLPRPGQGATDDDSDQTGTKDISRPSSGIQTLPALIPEGFRSAEREEPASSSSTRVVRDLPRPSRPRPEDVDENGSRTKNLPRPSQNGGDDQNEENSNNTKELPRPGQGATDDDSDQTGTKDISRPSSGIQTLPALIPEGFRSAEREEPASSSSTRVVRDLPRPSRPRPEDVDENGSRTKNLPRPSQNGGDDQNEENSNNTKELPRPGQGATDDDSDQTGTKDISRPSSGIQTLPALIPEGFRSAEREEPASSSSTRVSRDLPRPNRPGQEDDENDSRTKELPRPSQNGGDDQDGDDQDGNNTKELPRPGQGATDDDSDQKGTKDISRPSSGIQTLPAKVPEGFRPNGGEEDEEEEEESEE